MSAPTIPAIDKDSSSAVRTIPHFIDGRRWKVNPADLAPFTIQPRENQPPASHLRARRRSIEPWKRPRLHFLNGPRCLHCGAHA